MRDKYVSPVDLLVHDIGVLTENSDDGLTDFLDFILTK